MGAFFVIFAGLLASGIPIALTLGIAGTAYLYLSGNIACTELATSAEAFAEMYEFFKGRAPATTDVVPEPPGLDVLDLFEPFREAGARGLYYHPPREDHWNAAGQDLAARLACDRSSAWRSRHHRARREVRHRRAHRHRRGPARRPRG